MTSRIQDALVDAMSRLKNSDVAGATTTIRNALTGSGTPRRTGQHAAPDLRDGAARGRRLSDVLNALRARRTAFTPAQPRPFDRPVDDDPRFTSRTITSAAGLMNYKIYVPEDRGRELALILMLHGCSQDPDDFARGTRMNRLADEFGLIVAYPHQPRSANAQGCWNWFDRRHQQAGAGEPAMLATLARTLAAEFGIAPERVYAAGLSAGAAMAEILAETYPEVFSKVGLHSGLPYGAAHDVMSAFAAMKGSSGDRRPGKGEQGSRKIIIHGAADRTVHPSNSADLFERMRSRHRGSSIVVGDVSSAGRQATRQLLIDPSGTSLAEYLLIEGGGHAWSGGDRGGSFVDSSGPDASREMVTFFLRE